MKYTPTWHQQVSLFQSWGSCALSYPEMSYLWLERRLLMVSVFISEEIDLQSKTILENPALFFRQNAKPASGFRAEEAAHLWSQDAGCFSLWRLLPDLCTLLHSDSSHTSDVPSSRALETPSKVPRRNIGAGASTEQAFPCKWDSAKSFTSLKRVFKTFLCSGHYNTRPTRHVYASFWTFLGRALMRNVRERDREKQRESQEVAGRRRGGEVVGVGVSNKMSQPGFVGSLSFCPPHR